MRVSSSPSAMARAMKLVGGPRPTATMRRGRVALTTAYAAAASSRGNQSWFHRGAGGGPVPIASRSAAYSSIELKNETILGHHRAGQLPLHLERDAVEHVVVVLRIVVEHAQALRARFAAQAHPFLPRRVSPAGVGLVLGVGVHTVVNHVVGARDQFQDIAVERAGHMLRIGEVAHRAASII